MQTSIHRASRMACLAAVAVAPALGLPPAGQMPKEDVIDVPALAEGLTLSNLFQSDMVLQRDKPVSIWGWATPGESISVSFGDQQAVAAADADRRWQVTLSPLAVNRSPARLIVEGKSGSVVLDNVLVGDVWVLGGQSNMEFELAKVENGALEIASANYPLVRILTVPYGESAEPIQGFARLHEWSDWFGRHFRKGDWDVCTPEVARELSAIGYVFARRVHMASGVPIGVIDVSRGGTALEAWTPIDVLQAMESDAVRMKLAEWDPSAPEPKPVDDMNHPGNCFGGMIGPLLGLSVKGAIFHQGYNNTFEAMQGVRLYRDVFPEMIRAWREALGDEDLPFGILSLCTDGYPQTLDNYLEKMVDAGIHIRATQYRTFRDLREAGDEHVGFASSYDLRRRWYHPQLKLPAGERLARWALATEYGFGETLHWLPPALESVEPKGGVLKLTFDTEVTDPEDGAIQGFAIAGEDRRFQPATATYGVAGVNDRGEPRPNRRELLLESSLVAKPLHFRYAWGRNPLANLQAAGHKDLPFATQRSDEWDMGTVPLGALDDPVEPHLTRAQIGKLRAALRLEDQRRRIRQAEETLEDESAAHGGK